MVGVDALAESILTAVHWISDCASILVSCLLSSAFDLHLLGVVSMALEDLCMRIE